MILDVRSIDALPAVKLRTTAVHKTSGAYRISRPRHLLFGSLSSPIAQITPFAFNAVANPNATRQVPATIIMNCVQPLRVTKQKASDTIQ